MINCEQKGNCLVCNKGPNIIQEEIIRIIRNHKNHKRKQNKIQNINEQHKSEYLSQSNYEQNSINQSDNAREIFKFKISNKKKEKKKC